MSKVGRGSRKAGAGVRAMDGLTLGDLMGTPRVWYSFDGAGDDGEGLAPGIYAQPAWSDGAVDERSFHLYLWNNRTWFRLDDRDVVDARRVGAGAVQWRWVECSNDFNPADGGLSLLKLDTTKPTDPETFRPVKYEEPRR